MRRVCHLFPFVGDINKNLELPVSHGPWFINVDTETVPKSCPRCAKSKRRATTSTQGTRNGQTQRLSYLRTVFDYTEENSPSDVFLGVQFSFEAAQRGGVAGRKQRRGDRGGGINSGV